MALTLSRWNSSIWAKDGFFWDLASILKRFFVSKFQFLNPFFPLPLKGIILTLVTTVYLLLFHVTHQPILDCYDTRTGSLVPLRAMGSLQLLLFLLAVILHCRQVEWTARLDFLWQSQVSDWINQSFIYLFISFQLEQFYDWAGEGEGGDSGIRFGLIKLSAGAVGLTD